MKITTEIGFGTASHEVEICNAEHFPAAVGIILGLVLSFLLWIPILVTFLRH
jgi:hypothetical protein